MAEGSGFDSDFLRKLNHFSGACNLNARKSICRTSTYFDLLPLNLARVMVRHESVLGQRMPPSPQQEED